MYKAVEFPSENATLRGRLYNNDNPGKKPVIIMTHGYSATIEGMVADRYAEVFCDAGYAVLLYDHRNFGISDGEPRQQMNRWLQARGYRDAINFVSTLPQIDTSKIAVWGDSMSGGEAIVVAAIDHRIKAIVAQVPSCGPELPPPDQTINFSMQYAILSTTETLQELLKQLSVHYLLSLLTRIQFHPCSSH